jgi:hypothetical protein
MVQIDFDADEDRQIYISQNRMSLLHLEVQGEQKAEIQIGSHAPSEITITKLYGPAVVDSIRISLDMERVEWVIEIDGDDGWYEWGRAPGQPEEL